jgi:16S rRNA (cytidine1402-2'-O)-methyltransferase
VLFEAPGRVAATLGDLAAACGLERPGAVCRELTKLHESIVRGSLADLALAAGDGSIPPRGEFALVVGSIEGRGMQPAANAEDAARDADALTRARAHVEQLVSSGLARGDAARRVSSETGIPRRRLYGAGDSSKAP